MHHLGYYLRALIEGALLPFDLLPRWLGLSLFSALSGVALLWLIGKTSPQRLVSRARDQMTAALLETRLYLDYPSRVLRCQGRMLGWGLVRVATMLPSLLVAALPLGLCYLHLSARYAVDPVPLGQAVVVQLDLAPDVTGDAITLSAASEGLTVSAHTVFARDTHQLFARIRADRAGQLGLAIQVANTQWMTVVEAGARRGPVWRRRDSGFATLWSAGWKGPLPGDGALRAIVIDYPVRDRTYLYLPWWLYWMAVAMVAALALRRRLGVAL